MGYTHTFTEKKVTGKQRSEFIKVAKELLTVVRAQGISIVNGASEKGTEPTFCENDGVWFNGEGALGHETFALTFKDNWDFCKTNEKPYDLLVCLVLLAARDILGTEFTSDGDVNGEDWVEANDIYKSMLTK